MVLREFSRLARLGAAQHSRQPGDHPASSLFCPGCPTAGLGSVQTPRSLTWSQIGSTMADLCSQASVRPLSQTLPPRPCTSLSCPELRAGSPPPSHTLNEGYKGEMPAKTMTVAPWESCLSKQIRVGHHFHSNMCLLLLIIIAFGPGLSLSHTWPCSLSPEEEHM